MFRFIHASDLHLGAPFEGIRVESPEIAEALSRSTYEALASIVCLARDEGAAFVVLAGDLCNQADGNLQAHLALRGAARELRDAGIPLLMVHGNHDYLAPGRPDLDWPDNCTVFGPRTGEGEAPAEPAIVRFQGQDIASVFGLSYARRDETANLAKRYPKPPEGLFSVGLLHAACGPVSGHASYAPCTVDDLIAQGYDYWALGHVHKHSILRTSGPTIAYSGNPQGLNPNETGPRGCLLVTVDDSRSASVEFRETDAVRWHIEDVDIGSMSREQDLLDALEARLDTLSREGRTSLVRFRLVGRGPLYKLQADSSALIETRDHLRDRARSMSGPVWTESIQVRTEPDLDLDARRASEDLLGDFLRIADELHGSDERIAELAEMLAQPLTSSAAQALRDVGLTSRWVTPEKVREWLKQAEWMGADRLVRAEE